MSSWKKASKTGQKFHKERAQLEERKHLGILEKKKDYKIRALDFQAKRDLLINLKRKTLEKNPDEFYFNMANSQIKDGVHKLRDPFVSFTDDEIKLMKTQDKNYIKFHQQMELQKIEKLKSTMPLIDVDNMPNNQHRFFVEDNEVKDFSLVKKFDTHESLIGRKSNRLTLSQLENLKIPSWVDNDFLKEVKKNRSKKYKELVKRVNRNQSLLKLESHYDINKKTINPEQEYDEKFQNSNANNTSDKKETQKYSKIIFRKR